MPATSNRKQTTNMEATIPTAAVTFGDNNKGYAWSPEGLHEQIRQGFTAGALASGHTNESLSGKIVHGTEEEQENYAALSLQVANTGKDLTTSTQVGFSALGVQLANTTSALSVQSDKNAGELSVQATNNFNLGSVALQSAFNALTVQATLNRNDILLDSTKNAAAAILDATKNAAALTLLATQNQATVLAQIAECCCELKAGQIREADRVIGVIEANVTADLRAKLARLISVAPAGSVI